MTTPLFSRISKEAKINKANLAPVILNTLPLQLTLFFLPLLLLPIGLLAQPVVPGYMGKRLLGELHAAAIPAFLPWSGPTVDNTGGKQYGDGGNSKIGLSWRIGGRAQYIVGRRTSLLLGYEYTNTGVAFTAKTPPINASTTSDISIIADEHDLFMRLRCYAAEIGAENSIEFGMLAPLGGYARYTLQYEWLNGALLKSTTRYQNGDALGARSLGLQVPKGWDVNLGLEIGTRYILRDRLTLTIGIKTHLPIMAFFATPIDNSEEEYRIFHEDYFEYNQYAFQRAARERLTVHSLMMVNIGIGIFLF